MAQLDYGKSNTYEIHPDVHRSLREGDADRAIGALAPRDQVRNMARTLRDRGRDHPIGSGFRPVALGSLAVGPREWPIDIERPEQAKDSPASARINASACPEAQSRTQAELLANDEFAAAIRLGASKKIACPNELCRALGVRRAVYDTVVGRYRDEVGAGDWPRPGTDSDRVLLVLAVSGDVRFASRGTQAPA